MDVEIQHISTSRSPEIYFFFGFVFGVFSSFFGETERFVTSQPDVISHVRRTVDGIRTFSHSIPRKIYTKAPPAAEADDESIADEASEPRQERSRYYVFIS